MITLTCAHCGGAFQVPPYRTDAKYCSMKCYLAERWVRSGKCLRCGKATPTRFCSDTCRKAHWNQHGFSVYRKPGFWKCKMKLIKQLGGKCARCGNPDMRVLDINHLDRTQKVRPSGGQYTYGRRIKDWNANTGNMELLCANCHRIHTWEQMGYGKSIAADAIEPELPRSSSRRY